MNSFRNRRELSRLVEQPLYALENASQAFRTGAHVLSVDHYEKEKSALKMEVLDMFVRSQ